MHKLLTNIPLNILYVPVLLQQSYIKPHNFSSIWLNATFVKLVLVDGFMDALKFMSHY